MVKLIIGITIGSVVTLCYPNYKAYISQGYSKKDAVKNAVKDIFGK